MKSKFFKKVFNAAFAESEQWRQWFYDAVVADDDVVVGEDGAGRQVSALLLQNYGFLFHGTVLSSGYISCVGTLPEARGKGAASRLMVGALREAAARGMAFCELIPAADSLFFFYRRFGFATVFYVDRLHYTSLHRFTQAADGALCQPDADILGRLERANRCGVLHDAVQFSQVLKDMEIDGDSYALAATDGLGGEAMAFVRSNDSQATVRSLLNTSEAAADTVLAEVRRREPDKMIVVETPPVSATHAFMRSRGMGRIVDAGKILAAVAAAHKEVRQAIRLTDSLLTENSGIYLLSDGICRRDDAYAGHIDLDTSPDILTAILLGSPAAGNIFNIPAGRPYMAMMLD